MRSAGLWLAALLAAAPAHAAFPTPQAREADRRFGRGARVLALQTIDDSQKAQALQRYNAVHPSGARGLGVAAAGGRAAPADVHAAARSFLAETQASLGIDPQQLEMLRTLSGHGGHAHVLYRQVYKGLPVEFSHVKVHFDGAGKVLDVDSNFRRGIDLDVRPDVSASVAAYNVKKDLGEDVRTEARLVVVLDPQTGLPRLAWRFKANRDGRWVYYVDAHSGELILRYDNREYAWPGCVSGDAQGTIRGMLYPYDQQHPPVQALPMPHEYVIEATTGKIVATDTNGQYCFAGSGALGGSKIATLLQGPYIKVGNFRGQAAHYENGAATWNLSLPGGVASPSPYPNNAVLTSTVDIRVAHPEVVMLAPIFATFQVGSVSPASGLEAADILDDDQVSILDSSGSPVAFYVGNRSGFTGTPVLGAWYDILLRSNAAGQQNGYSVLNSSGLVITTPAGNGAQPAAAFHGLPPGPAGSYATDTNGSFDWWPASYTSTGLRAEAALFYHLNQMHDYFANGVDASGVAPLNPVEAMVLVGPDIVNAFYDPDYDDFIFGDHSGLAPDDTFTDDATVPHHEYTHFMVQKIFNIQNFGEAGAISEANADYFSASSLGGGQAAANSSSIGKAVNETLGNVGPLRQLDGIAHPPIYKLSPTGGDCSGGAGTCILQGWSGEIHSDSIFVSQSLWDLRRNRIAALGAGVGDKCVDELEFQALLFFPESFAELINSLILADKIGAAPDCGAAGSVGAANIATIFGNHGLPATGVTVDPYDTASAHNDGFETAVDISTLGPVVATIYPGSDIDFYTFAAGPGLLSIKLNLPVEGAYYSGYMITLFDHNHTQVAQAMAPYNGINTNFPFCTIGDCTTTAPSVTLNYNNPAGNQFYVEISGGPTDSGGSNSAVKNTNPYVLSVAYPRGSATSASIVSAQLDNDQIGFTIKVTTWTQRQDYHFSWARLLDQSKTVLPDTDAPAQTAGTKYLSYVSQTNALGQITGTVQLANGFNARFPSVGTVYLEVFAYNVEGSTVSLGLSNPLNLTTNLSDAHAWNNVFNPRSGQKTTVRYDLQSPGHLTMRLYTLSGNLVGTLFDGDAPAGKGSVDWTGQNTLGATVASGIYLLHIQGPGISRTQKIAVIK